MNKIKLKSDKIIKIGWNCAKTRFHPWFNAFSKRENVNHYSLQLQVSSDYWPITQYTYITKAKQLTNNMFFLHLSSSTFTQHNTTFEKIKIPKSLNPYSPSLNHPTQTQNKPTLSQVRQFPRLLLKDTNTLLYFFSGFAVLNW